MSTDSRASLSAFHVSRYAVTLSVGRLSLKAHLRLHTPSKVSLPYTHFVRHIYNWPPNRAEISPLTQRRICHISAITKERKISNNK